MWNDHERFKNIASGIQAISLAVAVLAGGLWSWYTFNSQLQIENAKAQLEKIKRDIGALPRLEFKLRATEVAVQPHGCSVIHATVEIKNVGNKDARLLLGHQPPLELFKVAMNDEGSVERKKIGAFWAERSEVQLAVLNVFAGSSSLVEFVVPSPDPGLYAITFIAPKTAPEIEAEGGLEPSQKSYWGGETYIATTTPGANPAMHRTCAKSRAGQ